MARLKDDRAPNGGTGRTSASQAAAEGWSPLARPHAKRRRPPRPWGFIISFVLLLGLVGTGAAARLTFALVAPHTMSPLSATLSREKRAQLDEELDIERPSDRDQAIDFALAFTAESLSIGPGPGRAPSFEFGVGKRKAGSAEYAALFVTVFEAASKRAGSTARAWRVNSQVRVFNKVIPLKGFGDHDWILVHDPADGARLYVDPMLCDAWLGASIARNVKGGAEIPLKPAIGAGEDPAKPPAGDAPPSVPPGLASGKPSAGGPVK
jgi:hypothetical protein